MNDQIGYSWTISLPGKTSGVEPGFFKGVWIIPQNSNALQI